MRRQPVQSTALRSIGYDPDTNILELEFRESGDVWQYLNFKPAAFKRLMTSESLGSFFVKKIKGRYPEHRTEE